MSEKDTHLEKLAAMRQEYRQFSLQENAVGSDPIILFEKWFNEAELSGVYEPNCMTLATVNNKNQPHARTVLLKGLEHNNFIFFTNYNSTKGCDITSNNQVTLLFFWKELERQVIIEGIANKTNNHISDTYFQSRPKGSQLAALASAQSEITTLENLNENLAKLTQQYQDKTIERPTHWGGYQVAPTRIEFWQGRPNRLHDRIIFNFNENKQWEKFRVCP